MIPMFPYFDIAEVRVNYNQMRFEQIRNRRNLTENVNEDLTGITEVYGMGNCIRTTSENEQMERNEERHREERRTEVEVVRSRVGSLETTTSQSTDYGSNESYTTNLQEILTRYHEYETAKSNGTLGTCRKTLQTLNNETKEWTCEKKCDETEGLCALCYEEYEDGDNITELPCGHVFHTGHSNAIEQLDVQNESMKRKRSTDGGCKGILYWLDTHLTCPTCRSPLPSHYQKPSASEQVIVPLLHRQYRVIRKKQQTIYKLKQEISRLRHELERERQRTKGGDSFKFLAGLVSPPPDGLPITW